jgi:hypothetical protein
MLHPRGMFAGSIAQGANLARRPYLSAVAFRPGRSLLIVIVRHASKLGRKGSRGGEFSSSACILAASGDIADRIKINLLNSTRNYSLLHSLIDLYWPAAICHSVGQVDASVLESHNNQQVKHITNCWLWPECRCDLFPSSQSAMTDFKTSLTASYSSFNFARVRQ